MIWLQISKSVAALFDPGSSGYVSSSRCLGTRIRLRRRAVREEGGNAKLFPLFWTARRIGINHAAQPNGGAGRDRTDDLKLAKLPLSQLSYGPISVARGLMGMVGLGGLEPPTS